MNVYIDNKKTIWLSKNYLKSFQFSENTIDSWKSRNCPRIYINGYVFVSYNDIPTPSRSKLPSENEIRAEYARQEAKEYFLYYRDSMQYVLSGVHVGKFLLEIESKYPALDKNKGLKFARLAAVYDWITSNVRKGSQNTLDPLFKAFCEFFPDRFSKRLSFQQAISEARKNGALSVAVDKRASDERTPTYGAEHKYLAEFILSHNMGFSVPSSYEKFRKACEESGYKIPCFRWFQCYYYDNRNAIERNRIGESTWQQNNANRARIIPALHAGDQWQIDGWTLPIYCYRVNDKGGKEYFFRYVLFAVMDAHSRKIVGFSIADSENTAMILKGLENAVVSTGVLPYEIVSDNHSFNRTQEANDLKGMLERYGVTWTTDSNPRRKAILERAFGTLGTKYFKECYGYIGQGIRSKAKNGITQQELKDLFTKPENMLSYPQVCLIACTVIKEYNETISRQLGASPADRYAASLQPNSIQIDDYLRVALFHEKKEYKVRHGQVSITAYNRKYQYQLPAEHSVKYNGKSIAVRFEHYDKIYLYDPDTDAPICTIKEMPAIHGALANQTDKDKELLLKNSGRIKGITSHMRKRRESLYDSASTINPNIYEVANRVTTPKDVLKKALQDTDIRAMLRQNNINIDYIDMLPIVDTMLDSSLKPNRKEAKHPFSVSNEIRKIEIKSAGI